MPMGRVAFFFTDLEGSTKQWEAHPDLMHAAVSRHDELMVESIERNSGIVFSTGGDGFVAVFPRVADAVRAGVELQRVLVAEPWPQPIVMKARMAVHVGVANLRGTNYFGSVVNRTARIMATGHGGQLLLSDDARNESSDVAVADLGVHYLKDLSAPEHLWQVLIDGLEAEFPPLRSLDRRQANLPMQLSGFVGRSREIDDVLGLLESNRLVTLRGLGGIGKTRLSLQIAAEAVGQSVDMVRFVALSPLADSASLSFHVLKTLGLSQPAGQTPVDTIATSIGSSSTLMVLDNCEHLDGAVPTLAVELLAACPNLRVLATSRNALGVAGEQVYAIEALPTGTNDSPAEQIFIARAQAANASIDFSGDREAVVSRICRRLDGIPLAIELAAARVRSMPPEEIERHLDERFRLLRSTKGFDERHRVLYDTLEWSYQHLEPDLQVLLRRLSVFAGLFTAADVVDVVGDDDHDLLLISDQLDELVDHSLVIADVSGEVAEYRLLDTVREFGAAALGEQREPLRARHAQYYAALSRRLFEQMLSPLEGAAVQHRNRVHDDIRAAYMWSRAHGRVDLVADIVARAAIDVMMHGRIEVAVWANEAVEQLDLAALGIADRCCLYQTAACLEINEGRAERARDLVGRAEELSLELAPDELPTDLVGGSSVCFFLGLLDQGDAIAERLATRLSTIGPSVALAVTIISRSAIHGYRNRPEAALEFAQTALTMLADDDVPTWRTLAEWQVDRYSDLEPLQLSERVRGHRDRFLQVRNAFLAATATRQLIGLESARATAQSQAMAGAIEAMGKLSMADPREAIGWMMQAAILLLHAGHYRAALTILGWEEQNRVTPVHPDQLAAIERLMPAARDALDDTTIAEATAAMSSATLRDAIDFTRAALVDASGQNSGD
ncbi:MAG TPA: NB-ARC domain-containing protein [Ilumatobacteraceae bacterium]|nr:NB-ARC domain-containing protein [Ilumatobacteraceae bacterium]